MREIFNANRSGAMPDQRRPNRPRPNVTDVRSGSMSNTPSSQPKPAAVPVRQHIVLRNGVLVVVDIK